VPIPNPGRLLAIAGVLGTCALASTALTACGSSDAATDTATTATAAPATAAAAPDDSAKQVRVAYFAQFINDFTQAEYNGAKDAVEAAGGTITLFDGGGDATKQVNQIQDAVTSGNFDVLAVDSVDGAAVAPAVAEAATKGVKTVAIFSPIGKKLLDYTPQIDGVVTVVGQDIAKNGRDIGDLTIQACKGHDPCNVAFLTGFIAAPYEKARLEAFKAQIATVPSIKLVSVQAAEYDEQKARTITQNLIQSQPDLNVIATAGEQMITGAIPVLDKAGLGPEKITLVSNGGGSKVIAQIKDGRVLASPVYRPFSLGKAAGDAAVQAGRGQQTPASIDAATLSPIGAIADKDNVGDYKAEYAG
jgi:ribose transport system substrate-binding protein